MVSTIPLKALASWRRKSSKKSATLEPSVAKRTAPLVRCCGTGKPMRSGLRVKNCQASTSLATMVIPKSTGTVRMDRPAPWGGKESNILRSVKSPARSVTRSDAMSMRLAAGSLFTVIDKRRTLRGLSPNANSNEMGFTNCPMRSLASCALCRTCSIPSQRCMAKSSPSRTMAW